MSAKWKRLNAEFHAAEGRDFERMVLPYVRYIWQEAILPRAMQKIDRSGVDIISWNFKTRDSIALAVQCKGFTVDELELGSDQIRQCRESIAAFRKSGLRTSTYVLLHNRIPDKAEFRDALKLEVEKLVADGLAKKAVCWNYQRLIQETRKRIREQCEILFSLKEEALQSLQIDRPLCEIVRDVPFQVSHLVIRPTAKLDETLITDSVADPTVEFLRPEISNLCVVLGPAGYGKTTNALRTFSKTDKKVFYLSAAKLPISVANKSALLDHLINTDDLWQNTEPKDMLALEKLVDPEVDHLLRRKTTPVVLVLDALDESIYFSRPGGLQLLFNHIRDYKVPVVLLAREEFWDGKQKDFATVYGHLTPNKERLVKQSVKIVRLKDWHAEQMVDLAMHYLATLKGVQRDNVAKFIELLEQDKYHDFYGDIPRRPLFLRYILESVADAGVKSSGRATLFRDWAVLKIRRDVLNPVMAGGFGRPAIVENAAESETAIRLAFKAMKLAARAMTSTENGALELLPSCNLDEVCTHDSQLRSILDPTGLFLHSLLIPTQFTPDNVQIEFAHRTYHEFFLAKYMSENAAEFVGMTIPESVQRQLDDIKAEGI